MDLRICSIKTNETIMPGYFTSYHEENKLTVLLINSGTLHIESNIKGTPLQQGDIVLGHNFKLCNKSRSISSVTGLVICNMPHEKIGQFFTIRKAHSLYNEFYPIVLETSQLMNTSWNSIKIMEGYLQSIFKSIYSIEKTRPTQDEKILMGPIDPRLILINRYIRKNYGQPITLQSLADLIQCNPTYLSNTYSKVFNISPIKKLQNIRMSKAAELLSNSRYSIGEIANHLGYISNSQFTELFKRFYGITPTQFRIKHSIVLDRLNYECR